MFHLPSPSSSPASAPGQPAAPAAADDDDAAVERFITGWQGKDGGERANYQLFIFDLCDLLGVPPPRPASSDNTQNAYVFERSVSIAARTDPHPAVAAGARPKPQGSAIL